MKDGETGLLITPGDVQGSGGRDHAAARTIPNDAQRWVQTGLEHVKNFQASTVIPRYEALYTRLLNNHLGPLDELHRADSAECRINHTARPELLSRNRADQRQRAAVHCGD